MTKLRRQCTGNPITETGLGYFGKTYCPVIAQYIAANFEPAVRTGGNWQAEPGWANNHGVIISGDCLADVEVFLQSLNVRRLNERRVEQYPNQQHVVEVARYMQRLNARGLKKRRVEQYPNQ